MFSAQLCQVVNYRCPKLDNSERRACTILDIGRSSLRYQAKPVNDTELLLAMIRIAKQFGCYGYRRFTALLRIEGWRFNHKKIERLWGEEGLQLPRRYKKRKRLYHKDSFIIRLKPTHPNHIWAMDFFTTSLAMGAIRMLAVLDEYTREALCVAVRPKVNAHDVLDAPHPLFMKHGKLEFIRSNIGPEYIVTLLQGWLKKVGTKPMQIYPGSP